MLKEFKDLAPEEATLMMDAIPLVTILVAGADGEMDEVELAEAKRIVDIRSFDTGGQLHDFYELLEQPLAGRIVELAKELPHDVTERQKAISERLAGLNNILPKLRQPLNYLYYSSFRSFAKHIAKSSGGFLRFMTVSPEEAEVVNLPMISPVEKPDERDFPNLL
jgi:hypothetical protein